MFRLPPLLFVGEVKFYCIVLLRVFCTFGVQMELYWKKRMEEKNIEKWKVLSSEYLFREPWLTVRRQRMELPNGAVVPAYYVLEYPAWVCVIALTKEGKMIMVRQYRVGIERVLRELCAGVVEPEDATFMDAAKRELSEETGYGNGKWELYMTTSANPGTHANLTYCFLATDVEKVEESHPERTEDLSVELCEPEEVLRMLQNDEILQSMHAVALWKYFYNRK